MASKAESKVPAVPEGYHSVIPYLIVRDAASAIDFYKTAFGAQELFRMPMPGGKIGHAELKMGDAHVMLTDEWPDMGAVAPKPGERPSASVLLYVDDVDATVDRAVKAGAKIKMPVEDQFYGDRTGQIEDPQGHYWSIATHIEDVSPEELGRRAKEKFGG
jgi:PhnB protein